MNALNGGPIRLSKQDTDETIHQALRINQFGIDQCGWGK